MHDFLFLANSVAHEGQGGGRLCNHKSSVLGGLVWFGLVLLFQVMTRIQDTEGNKE